jgi:hypothetical protein
VAPDELFPNRQQSGFDFGLEVQGRATVAAALYASV